MNKAFVQKLSDRIFQALPSDLQDMRDETREVVCTAVQSLLQELDVVSREEFDVQTKVLAKTREKLRELETKVAALEQSISPQ